MAAELDATETMEEVLVGIARARWHVESKTVEIGYGSFRHGCLTNDVMKG